MKIVSTLKSLALAFMFVAVLSFEVKAQVCEWQLNNVVYSSIDPDGAGPAVGSVTFTLQIHTTAGTIPNVNVIATGWNWQSTRAMIPTTPGCAIVSNPANVTVSPAFTAAGFAYTTVNQCGIFNQTLGGEVFDRRAVGTLDGTAITLTTAWVDVFTVTMWSLNSTTPHAGYATINSGSGGSPAEFTTYSVSDVDANEFPVNSLTVGTPLLLGPPIVTPVIFTNYNATCSDKGASLTWTTATEQNSSRFEVERSDNNGFTWKTVGTVAAAGNSSDARNYNFLDLYSGDALYRIRQVDLDGKGTYTTAMRTNCKTAGYDIVLYPVPAKDNLAVVIKSDAKLRTDLIVMDMKGSTLFRVPAYINTGSNTINLNVSALPAGQYVLRSSDPAVQIDKKFTISR